ncbi:MAG: ABC transporter ATP-binding protein/permease, partial [Lachnospiraceae bacterium]|nr:ABC transporter ATP-binding protein/permease [Lachnospiraceae bacterium]
MKSNLKAGLSFIGRNRVRYVVAVVLSSAITSFCYNIVLAVVMKNVIDAIQFQEKALFFRGLALAAGSFLVAFTVEPIVTRIRKTIVRELTADLRVQLVKHITEFSAAQYESLHAGDIITTVMQDVQKTEELFLSYIPNLCFAVIHGVAAMVFMAYYNIGLCAIAILLGMIQVAVGRRTGRDIQRTAMDRQQASGSVLQQVTETMDGRVDIEGCDAEAYFYRRFGNCTGKLAEKELKARMASGNVIVMDNMIYLINRLVIMGIGLVCVQRGYLSVGVIAAVLNLQGNATYLFQNYTSFSVGLANCIPSIERIIDLLQLERENCQSCVGTRQEIGAPEIIELEHISFAYQGSQHVLQDMNMKFEKGKFYCIAGNSGSGKSTVQKLLLKFYEPQEGTYRIGGCSCANCSCEEVREQFAYVGQNSNLFALSIGENLRLVREEASEEELELACREAEAYDFIAEQGGYDYEIDSSLDNLSGGQKQRIELARMFLSDRPVWLIDEGTAHLDK